MVEGVAVGWKESLSDLPITPLKHPSPTITFLTLHIFGYLRIFSHNIVSEKAGTIFVSPITVQQT